MSIRSSPWTVAVGSCVVVVISAPLRIAWRSVASAVRRTGTARSVNENDEERRRSASRTPARGAARLLAAFAARGEGRAPLAWRAQRGADRTGFDPDRRGAPRPQVLRGQRRPREVDVEDRHLRRRHQRDGQQTGDGVDLEVGPEPASVHAGGHDLAEDPDLGSERPGEVVLADGHHADVVGAEGAPAVLARELARPAKPRT